MSEFDFDYEASLRIEVVVGELDAGFYAVIMAAMRMADTDNLHKLQKAFPAAWDELQYRYNAPGGGEEEKQNGCLHLDRGHSRSVLPALRGRAAAAMGWHSERVRDPSGIVRDGKFFDNWFDASGRGMHSLDDWHPWDDLGQAFEVIERVAERLNTGWVSGESRPNDSPRGKYWARVYGHEHVEYASTIQEALLLAACAASEEAE